MIGRDHNVPAAKCAPRIVIPHATFAENFPMEVGTVIGLNKTTRGASAMAAGATS